MDKPTMQPLNPSEKKRTYTFPSGKVEIENVSAICVRASGTHRLETADGKKIIIPAGWLMIELDVESWTL